MNHDTSMQKSQNVRHSNPAGNLHASKPKAAERNRPPVKRSDQKFKKRNWKQQEEPHAAHGPRRPLRPDDLGYENTRKGRQQQLFRQLLDQYGPNFADTDVRLYLKKRQLNAAKQRPSRRGGFPLDDSFDKPGTFLKLKPEFQRRILTERCEALTAALRYQLPAEVAWQLYTHIPGLLTYMTLEVAHKIKALAATTGLHPVRLVPHLCSYRPLAFLHPGSVESRLGLIAKLARIDRVQAVQLMIQHPQLWMMNSRLLGPRAEELALMLHCCTTTALKLIAQRPQLVTAQQTSIQQQLTQLLIALGCIKQPAALVPLLLWQPALLLPPQSAQQHADSSSIADMAARQSKEAVTDSKNSVTPQQVVVQLQALVQQLDLPQNLARLMILRSPELLLLRYSNKCDSLSATTCRSYSQGIDISDDTEQHCCAAGLNRLQESWLCTSEAVQQRQRYQQTLMHMLSPKRRKQRKQQQHKQQPLIKLCRHDDAGAGYLTAASCQWWNRADFAEQMVELQPLQHILVQAPGLLCLAATTVTQTDTASSPVSVTSSWSAAAAPAVNHNGKVVHTDALHSQLHRLCEELLRLLPGTQQEVQQQQPPSIKFPAQQCMQPEELNMETTAQLLQQLQAISILEPNLVAQAPTFVVSQTLQLSRILMVSSRHLWDLLQHCPALLWLTNRQVFCRVRILCGILKLPAAQVRERLLTPIVLPVLLLEDDQLRAAFNSLVDVAAATAKTEEDARDVLRQGLELILPGNQQLFNRVVHKKT